jgi:hypothetical protein
MKLLLPELDIKPDAGFDKEADIFNRREFGERLANLVENTSDCPVIALDSGWGEGKSTFIKMWKGHVEHHREKKIKTIYFDAFENDFQKDPFLTLASEIYSLIEDEDREKKEEFTKKAVDVAKSLARGAINIGIKMGTSGLVDGTVLDSAENDISKLISGNVDQVISSRFENVTKDKLALKNFKQYLEMFANNLSSDSPIVFIIDELDRCRPDFALELLEQIKHLFSVKGITFLLVTNRGQLEEIIRHKYGKDIDATRYLNKFVSLWLTLPKKNEERDSDREKFLKYTISVMSQEGEAIGNIETIEVLHEMVRFYDLSFREIQKILSYFSIINNMINGKSYHSHYQHMIALICYLMVVKPSILKSIDRITYSQLIEDIGLSDVDDNTKFYSLLYLKKYIKYELADEEEKKKMVANKEIGSDNFGRYYEDTIKQIVSWLSEMQRN